MVQVLAPTGMWQVNLPEVPESSQEAALRKVVRMVIGREDGVKPHPFQLVKILRIGARIGATGPLPGTFVVVEEELEIGNTDVSVTDNLHEFEKVQFSKGAHAPRNHGVPHHGNAHVPTFCVIYHGHLLPRAVLLLGLVSSS